MPPTDVDRQVLVVVYGVPVGQMLDGELTLFPEIDGEMAQSLCEKLRSTENCPEAWTQAYKKLHSLLNV